MKKKLIFWLQHADGIWSVPLIIAFFWLAGNILQAVGGYGTGSYDLAFVQPLLLAIGIVVGATNAAIWGVFFTFRGLYRYMYGQRKYDAPGGRINYSKIDWLKLTVWQRYLVAFGCFFFFVAAILLVYLKLV